jgi:hypothetical protein
MVLNIGQFSQKLEKPQGGLDDNVNFFPYLKDIHNCDGPLLPALKAREPKHRRNNHGYRNVRVLDSTAL